MPRPLPTLLLAAGLLAVATPTLAATPTAHTSAPIAIRTGPGDRYDQVGKLGLNQHVTLAYCTVNGMWCQLGSELTPEFAGYWVRATYLIGMGAKAAVTPFTFSVNPPAFR